VRADIYQKLYEFNLHIDQGEAALRDLAQVKKASAGELLRYAEYLEENRTAASGYLTSIVSDQEEREAGRLFSRRRRREMAEDPMHGGWLEEEREKKRLKELREANKLRQSRPKRAKT
jgi:hypothetical protein